MKRHKYVIVALGVFIIVISYAVSILPSEYWSELDAKFAFQYVKYRITSLFSKNEISFEEYLNPAKAVITDYFVIESPAGWFVESKNKSIQDTYTKILYFANVDTAEYGFQFSPYFTVYTTEFNTLKNDLLETRFHIFLSKMGVDNISSRMIANKKCLFLRYKGVNSYNSDIPEEIAENLNRESITICYQFEDLPFWGYFWGFEEDEKVFWECLNSIEWKE